MRRFSELISVRQPNQYVGTEENVIQKDFDATPLKLCLAFPDAYEIGMANVGMQILYRVSNLQDGVVADRIYAPREDMEKALRASSLPHVSRQYQRPLKDFDWVGFSLQYELGYTNVLLLLDLCQLTRLAAERQEGEPLIAGGGPCAMNAEPMAEFFDFFVLGEGEEVMRDVNSALLDAKRRGLSRREKLRALSKIGGIYVPAFYETRYSGARLESVTPREGVAPCVTRRVVADLDAIDYPQAPVMPALKPVHDRIGIEIQRGCTRGCRFCQAGYIYRPRRERHPKRVIELIERSVEATGNPEISLMSLSSADYSSLGPLMDKLAKRHRGSHLNLALPSTRPEMLKREYLQLLGEERRAGVTIAPEAGSQRLRDVINKGFTEEEILRTIRTLFEQGWHSVKLYFMIGLPTETDEDVRAIGELANSAFRAVGNLPGRKSITVSVSNFVPKPHTPFQWVEQIGAEEIRRRQQLVRGAIQYPKSIAFKCHESRSSRIEGVLSRGSRLTARLISMVYDRGARFDCWNEHFRYDLWDQALAEIRESTGVDLDREAFGAKEISARLPWDHLSSGVARDHLVEEYQRGLRGELTPDCSFDACTVCGLCTGENKLAPVHQRATLDDVSDTLPARETAPESEGEERKWRFKYRRVGAGVFVSTLEMQGMIFRAFRRAGIPMVYDEGMRPRPKLAMGQALPLGVTSQGEYFDMSLTTTRAISDVVARLNRYFPADLAILDAGILASSSLSIRQMCREHVYRAILSDLACEGLERETVEARVAEFPKMRECKLARSHKTGSSQIKTSEIDLRKEVLSMRVRELAEGVVLEFSMNAEAGQSASPYAVIEWLLGDATAARRIQLHKI